jgi:hypothetical protein
VAVPGTAGEAGEDEEGRVGVVAYLRAVFGGWFGFGIGVIYVSRTTHDVVIAQLGEEVQEEY